MHVNIYGGRLYLSPSMHAHFPQTDTPLSRLGAESIVIHIHEIIIINVTRVISFLLSRDELLHLETNQLQEKWQLGGSPAEAVLCTFYF